MTTADIAVSSDLPWRDPKVREQIKQADSPKDSNARLTRLRADAHRILDYFRVSAFDWPKVLADVGSIEESAIDDERARGYIDALHRACTAWVRRGKPDPTPQEANRVLGSGGSRRIQTHTTRSETVPTKKSPTLSKLNEETWKLFREETEKLYELSPATFEEIAAKVMKGQTLAEWIDDGNTLSTAKSAIRTEANIVKKAQDAAKPKQNEMNLDASSQNEPVVEDAGELAKFFDQKAAEDKSAPTPPATPEKVETVKQATSSPATEPVGSGTPVHENGVTSPGVSGEENRSLEASDKDDPPPELVNAYRDTAFARLEKRFPKANKQEIGEIHYQMTGYRTAFEVVKVHGLSAGLDLIDDGIAGAPDPEPDKPKEIMVIDQPAQPVSSQAPTLQLAPVGISSWLNVPNREEQRTLEWYAGWAAGSGLFPNVNTTAKAMTIILLGYSLKADPNVSLLNIPLINGKPWPNAAILRSAVLTRKPNDRFDVMLDGPERAKAICKREGGVEIELIFTKDDAIKMGLWENEKTAWKKAPKHMLMNRVSRMAVMQVWPDIAMGMGISQATLEPDDD